jgi:ABC-2 type transport system permease protein
MSVFRWSFFDTADVPIAVSLLAIAAFTALCLAVVWWIFRSGWRIRQ